MTDKEDQEAVTSEKYRTRVIISSLGNERRTIELGELDQDHIQSAIRTVDAAFQTVRHSNSLMFTDKSGIVIFANLDNVAFVEVQVG